MKTHIFKNLIIISLSFLALTSCGGGGSGNPSPPVANSPPQPTPASGIVIVDSNSSNSIASYSISLPEALMQVAQLLLSEVGVQKININENYQAALCSGSGNVNINWTDIDGNQTISVSDKLTLTFSSCNSSTNDDHIDGEITLEVNLKTDESITYNTSVDITSINNVDSINTTITGSFTLMYGQNVNEEHFQIASNNQNLTFVVDGKKEEVLSLDLQKTVDSFYNYSIDYNTEMSSEMLGGSITCTTVESMKGIMHAFPYALKVECAGDANGLVRLHTFLDEGSLETDSYALETDTNYSYIASSGGSEQKFGTFLGDIVEGAMTEAISNFIFPEPPDSTILEFEMPPQHGYIGLVVNQDKNLVYVFGVSTTAGKGQLLVLDLNTMELIEAVQTEYPIYKLTYSNQSNLIYYSGSYNLPNTPKILTIQQDDLSIQSEISFEAGVNVPEENQTAWTYYSIHKLLANELGELYLIVEDDYSKFTSDFKLIKIKDGQFLNSASLGMEYAQFAIDESGNIYTDQFLAGYQEKKITKFDANLNLVDSKIFNHPSQKNRGDSNAVKQIINGQMYTGNGYVFDWNNSDPIADFGYYDMYYIPELNIALELDPFSEFSGVIDSNQSINTFSLESYKKIGTTIEYDKNMPTLNILNAHLVGNQHMIVFDTVYGSNGTCPCVQTFMKIPLKNMY